MKKMFKKLSQIAVGVVIVVVITFIANAFTEPTQAPPGGNVSAPLNTSATIQTKTGKLSFPWFEDSDSFGYFVDPGGNSRLYRTYTFFLHIYGNIFGPGSTSNYGALTIDGSKNGWGGINFKSGGINLGTLMVHSAFQGFYNDSDNNWDWYFTNGELTEGTVPWSRITGAPGDATESDTLQSVTNRGRSTTQNLRSPRFEDTDNTDYYADPNTASRLNAVDADSVINRSGVSVYKCPNRTQESTCGGQGGWNGCHGQITTDTFCYFKVGTTDANGFPYCYFEATPCSYVGKLVQ